MSQAVASGLAGKRLEGEQKVTKSWVIAKPEGIAKLFGEAIRASKNLLKRSLSRAIYPETHMEVVS